MLYRPSVIGMQCMTKHNNDAEADEIKRRKNDQRGKDGCRIKYKCIGFRTNGEEDTEKSNCKYEIVYQMLKKA